MIGIDDIREIYLVKGVTDLRKGIDGYAAVIQSRLHRNPADHSLYLFCNRTHDKLKCLYYDGTGFWLLYKRLNEGHFKWIRSENAEGAKISRQQLRWVLEGLKPEQKGAFKEEEGEYN